MAQFRYLGEPSRPWVVSYGPALIIKLRPKTGGIRSITPIPPAVSFVIGEDIGYDITDERELRYLRNDPRFQEII